MSMAEDDQQGPADLTQQFAALGVDNEDSGRFAGRWQTLKKNYPGHITVIENIVREAQSIRSNHERAVAEARLEAMDQEFEKIINQMAKATPKGNVDTFVMED